MIVMACRLYGEPPVPPFVAVPMRFELCTVTVYALIAVDYSSVSIHNCGIDKSTVNSCNRLYTVYYTSTSMLGCDVVQESSSSSDVGYNIARAHAQFSTWRYVKISD